MSFVIAIAFHPSAVLSLIHASVQKGVPPPPSLVNMYKELETDIEGFVRPSHGYLGGWAEQGVLLLNACLTVRKGEANSHKDKGIVGIAMRMDLRGC